MRATRFFIAFCLLLLFAGGVFVLSARRPAIDAVDPPAATSFAAAQVRRGAELAAIGDCGVCHTAPGGLPFAGGVAVPTPFGTIYSTNITPDPATGIGHWSEVAFRRAMREGVRRDGGYLYPAFPYDHFTLVSDDDDRALYAFLMTRKPVSATAPANRLPFPINIRLVMFGWNVLFLHKGPYRPDSAQSDAWNEGAYLAQGLGHCGACHTPRNILGAEKAGEALAGGEVEGWTAYALDASSAAPVPWTAAELTQYLHRGFDPHHGVARGPMAPVVQNLRTAPEHDAQAIATYVAAQMRETARTAQPLAAQLEAQARRGKDTAPQSGDSQAAVANAVQMDGNQGAAIYASACAGCHQGPRAMPYGGIDLALSSAIAAPSARNLLNVVLYGLPAAAEAHAPIMPGFAVTLSDQQLVTLAAYLRAHFSSRPAWTDMEKDAQQARSAGRAATTQNAPTDELGTLISQRTDHEAQP